ncbi:unnamed protein product [Ilex paraguariensis]|uniref:Uncharacterized protein n=1 Tax=Ilex paraguariensis TaxID=185542 RepID=A0ABC8UKQ4_9AQUA
MMEIFTLIGKINSLSNEIDTRKTVEVELEKRMTKTELKFSFAEVKLSKAKKNYATLSSQVEAMSESLAHMESRVERIH